MNKSSDLFIILVNTNEKHFLKECIDSIVCQTYNSYTIVLVDNNSSDGSVAFVKSNYPFVKIIELDDNVGYARANNIGLRYAFEEKKAKFCLVLNCDISADKNMFSSLIETFETASKKHKVGLIQPILLMHDDNSIINTVGNAIHYLGFGYCKDYGKTYRSQDYTQDRIINSVSGAGLFISREYFLKIGAFDEEFFIYNEDQNLSWRGLMQGYQHILSHKAILYHKYNFHRRSFKMYHSEKNRLSMLLENYNAKTLFTLFPIIIFIEVALLAHSLLNGWFIKKIQSYEYVIKNMSEIMRIRTIRKKTKKINDKQLIAMFDAELESTLFENKIISFIINPILRVYYKLALLII